MKDWIAGGAITVRGSKRGKGTQILGSIVGICGHGSEVIQMGKRKMLLER